MTLVQIFILFSLSVSLLYALILLMIHAGLSRSKLFRPDQKKFSTHIIVIIPARNEEDNILSCLKDMLAQDFPAELLEVIVVDDHSSDHTYDLAIKFASDHSSFPLTVLGFDRSDIFTGSKKDAITLAISKSSGELILATDADTHHGKYWIASMVSFYEKFKPAMILAPVAYSRHASLFSRIQEYEFMGLMAATEGSCAARFPLMCNGANLAYTRKAFEETGGFSDNRTILSGDDMFLMMKIRKQFGKRSVMFNKSPEAVVTTEPNKSLNGFINQRLRWVSKNRKIRNPFVLLGAVITWLFNAILFAGLIIGFFSSQIWILAGILFIGKIAFEFIILRKYTFSFGKKVNFAIFLLTQVFNIFYVTVIGFLGNILSYRWKGRTNAPAGNPLK